MTRRENTLRAMRFETPEYIPMVFAISSACWHHYPPEALEDLMAAHPLLFPGYEKPPEPYQPVHGPLDTAGKPYTDEWGCVWETAEDGITGTVKGHPLADWEAFETFTPPDPALRTGFGPIDWPQVEQILQRQREAGELVMGSLRHGHTFLLLCDLRGYENLLYDMADDEPRLHELIAMVEHFNLEIVKRFVSYGVDVMGYPEDLGMQVGPMLSPAHFRKYIVPVYKRLIAPAREAGILVHMHSDGDIRELMDDLLECGIDVINLQDLVNGLDWIEARLKGKVCIDLDVDRQQVTVHGTPADVDALVREEVERLGSKRGGLMMIHGMYPGEPLENVEALMDAMEKYAFYYS